MNNSKLFCFWILFLFLKISTSIFDPHDERICRQDCRYSLFEKSIAHSSQRIRILGTASFGSSRTWRSYPSTLCIWDRRHRYQIIISSCKNMIININSDFYKKKSFRAETRILSWRCGIRDGVRNWDRKRRFLFSYKSWSRKWMGLFNPLDD